MLKHVLVAAVLVVAAIAAPAANAAKFHFGVDNNFHRLQTLSIPQGVDPDSLPPEWRHGFQLAGRVETQEFGLGVWMQDKGYVIVLQGSEQYWDLDADRISELQAAGILPDPLPKYQLDLSDYLFGYMLWISLALVALSIAGHMMVRHRLKHHGDNWRDYSRDPPGRS